MYPCLDYEIKEHGLSLFADMYSVAMEFFLSPVGQLLLYFLLYRKHFKYIFYIYTQSSVTGLSYPMNPGL